MAQFVFRLQSLLKLRAAHRNRRREELADAFRVERTLLGQLEMIDDQIRQNRDVSRAAAQPGTLDVDHLLGSHRHELLLTTRQRQLQRQRDQVQAEIERRRQLLVQAERAVKILENLREKQAVQHAATEQRAEMRQLDEVALRRVLIRRGSDRP
jgi:flagellar export protein FliJ